VVLFTLCALNEIFFIALYLLSFSSPYLSPELLQQIPANTAGATAPSSMKAFLNPHSAAAFELRRSNKMVRISFFDFG
jgi:CDP-diacylglycerol--inositol 3-phosphatidyltransferase